MRESAGWLDLSARGKIRVTGEDRARLLHAMTTQDVQSLVPGQGRYAFFLNAQGRILGDVNIFCREDSFLLDTEPETRQKLYDHIDRYIIADDVTLEDITDEMSTIAIEGPRSAAVLERLGAPLPEADYATRDWMGSIVARVSFTGAGGYSIFLPPTKKAELIAALDIPQATAEEARTVRIEHGRPRYGEEISERYLVQETAQLDAVSFSKGCYLGQEIVERVRSRAQIHRVLRRLAIDTNELPQAGAKLKSGDADCGEIASAVNSPALGKVAALAYVRTPFAEPGTEMRLGDARAVVL
ncbi:MAG: folate-binding protein [Acidobacteriota bacterium]|nr:folate-binding protein [Acidobacteriota bacterium]